MTSTDTVTTRQTRARRDRQRSRMLHDAQSKSDQILGLVSSFGRCSMSRISFEQKITKSIAELSRALELVGTTVSFVTSKILIPIYCPSMLSSVAQGMIVFPSST
ncbi:hypothetical protein B0H12DRAFT_1150337 [Mycena haematopus]|nr:hypothetical protein B0H12DRAFT_1150337 [Mycena haematopus]